MSYTDLRKIIENRVDVTYSILRELKEPSVDRMMAASDYNSKYWEGRLAAYMAVIDIIDDLDNEAPDMVE